MRTLSLVRGAWAGVALGALVACDLPKSTTPSHLGVPFVAGIEMTGPASIPPGETAQFAVVMRLSDGTRKASSPANVRWHTGNPSVLSVDASGLATAGQMGDTTVTVQVTVPGSGARVSTKDVAVLPDGTFRMDGVVRDGDSPTSLDIELPVFGARIEVSPGSLVATSGFDGRYRIYGVPANASVTVTLEGYRPVTESVHLTAAATRNFSLNHVAGPGVTLAGPYTLAFDTVGSCSIVPPPTDLQHRRYDAVVTQSGSRLDVALTEPRFKLDAAGRGNHFIGRVDPAGATLIFDSSTSFGHYPDIIEQLPNGTVLLVGGAVVAMGSGAGLSGMLQGDLTHYAAGFPNSRNYLGGFGYDSAPCFLPVFVSLTPR